MITLRSVYDIKTFKAFQRYSLKRVFILAYSCAVLAIGVGIAFVVFSLKNYLIYFMLGIGLPILMHIFYRAMEVETINRNLYLRDTTMQIFRFNEEGFELEQISKIDTFKDKYTYKDIYSIIKYKRYYFIYINRSQAFIVNNRDYVSGSEEELDKLFKEAKGDRFIVKRNSRNKKNIESK